MKTTEYVFNGQTYVCRIVLSNEGEELIIGSTSLLDAIQPGDFRTRTKALPMRMQRRFMMRFSSLPMQRRLLYRMSS